MIRCEKSEDRGRIFLQNVSIHLQGCMMSQPKVQESEQSLPLKPQNLHQPEDLQHVPPKYWYLPTRLDGIVEPNN